MTALSVNVNKWATLRNARGKNLPDIVASAERILSFGAHGITVHPRPDQRHIRTDDVSELKQVVDTWNRKKSDPVEFNVEGYPSAEFLGLIKTTRPHQATLVPDPPEALTSNAGWNLKTSHDFLRQIIPQIQNWGIRVSLFVDPAEISTDELDLLNRLRPDRVELYTEGFADAYGTPNQATVTGLYRRVGLQIFDLGIGLNAGHDLNQQNLGTLLTALPCIEEVSIGHALICEAIEQGLSTTLKNYLHIIAVASQAAPMAAPGTSRHS